MPVKVLAVAVTWSCWPLSGRDIPIEGTRQDTIGHGIVADTVIVLQMVILSVNLHEGITNDATKRTFVLSWYCQ